MSAIFNSLDFLWSSRTNSNEDLLLESDENHFIASSITKIPDCIALIRFCVKISCLPHKQCCKIAYFDDNKNLKSKVWNKYKKATSETLVEMGVPLKKEAIELVLKVLDSNRFALCINSNILYPARFKAEFYCENAEYSDTQHDRTEFELEIHSEEEIYFLFPQHPKITSIAKGSFKEIVKAFPIGQSQVVAYSQSRLGHCDKRNTLLAQQKEEFYLKKFNTHPKHPHIINVSRIFYYENQEQVIVMDYHKQDLLTLLNEYLIDDQKKIEYSKHIIETVIYLHQHETIHRDLSDINILVGTQGLSVIDFGLACSPQDKELNGTGTYLFSAPEAHTELRQSGLKREALDVWSVGCLLWLIWSNGELFYPWYQEASKPNRDLSKIFQLMQDFDKIRPDPSLHLLHFLWKMLRFDSKERCDLPFALHFVQENLLSSSPIKNTLQTQLKACGLLA